MFPFLCLLILFDGVEGKKHECPIEWNGKSNSNSAPINATTINVFKGNISKINQYDWENEAFVTAPLVKDMRTLLSDDFNNGTLIAQFDGQDVCLSWNYTHVTINRFTGKQVHKAVEW